MRFLRFPLVFLMAVLAFVALDIAVIRSLLREAPGSNQTLYLVPIDGATWLSFAALALGVLPMASLLVLNAMFQVPKIRRSGTVSAFWLGFEIFGWFSVFLFMVVSSFSPAAIQNYLTAVGRLVGSQLLGLMGDEPASWLINSVELAMTTLLLVLPELLLATAAGWLLGRAGARTVTVRFAGESSPLP